MRTRWRLFWRRPGVFTTDVLAPLNRKGDIEGARYENGRVTAAPGFAEAYKAFVAGGWNSLSADPEYGGQGLSWAAELAVFEMVHASNMAFGAVQHADPGRGRGPGPARLGASEAAGIAETGLRRMDRDDEPDRAAGRIGPCPTHHAQTRTEPADTNFLVKRSSSPGRLIHDAADNICRLVLARDPRCAAWRRKRISLFPWRPSAR